MQQTQEYRQETIDLARLIAGLDGSINIVFDGRMLGARCDQYAVVSRVDDTGRVYVTYSQTNKRGRRRTRDVEVWFDAHETHRLRLVDHADGGCS